MVVVANGVSDRVELAWPSGLIKLCRQVPAHVIDTRITSMTIDYGESQMVVVFA
jgi:hypothetical protein